MNSTANAIVAGSILLIMGTVQPDFAQNKSSIPDSTWQRIAKNTKQAMFETKEGDRVGMTLNDDNDTAMRMFSMGAHFGGYVISIMYTEALGVGMGFTVIVVDPNKIEKMVTIMGSGGKVETYTGLDSKEDAEKTYVSLVCGTVLQYARAIKDGKTLGSQLSQTEQDEIYKIFLAETELCLPAFMKLMKEQDDKKIRPQKFSIPKNGTDPLYRSSNYLDASKIVLRAIERKNVCSVQIKPRSQLPYRA